MTLSGDPLLVKALGMAGPRMIAEAVWSVVALRPRSLSDDSQRLIARLDPVPKIEDLEHVPTRDSFLLVANHFQAPGLWVGWVAMAITAAVASVRQPERRETHWMITAEWRGQVGGREMVNPSTSAIFPRAARTWGLISLPTDPADVVGRARALRQALGYLGRRGKGSSQSGEPVAIFPEGMGSIELREAKSGSGAFMQRVSALGVPLLPVGVHAESGALVIRFGEPFSLPGSPGRANLDDWARAEVMSMIGRLLPRHLWGAYADTIEKRTGDEGNDKQG